MAWAVAAARRAARVGRIDLNQLREVHSTVERALDGWPIRSVPIRGELYPARKAAGQVVDERPRGFRPASADQPSADQLAVGIQRGPRPNVAVSEHALLFGGDVALLR